jgi:TRAP-type transport system small permease protein
MPSDKASAASGPTTGAAPAPVQKRHAAPTPNYVRALEILSALCLFAIVALTFVDVFARYLFASPIKGSLEIIQFAMALVIFTALPLVTRTREHVTVSLIEGLVTRPSTRRIKQVACDVVSLFAVVLLAWRLWVQASEYVQSANKTIVLAWPMAPLTYFMSICAAATAIVLLVQIFKDDKR